MIRATLHAIRRDFWALVTAALFIAVFCSRSNASDSAPQHYTTVIGTRG